MTTIYLAGPMNGLPEWNHAYFDKVTALLRDKGYAVINPAENDSGTTHKGFNFYFRLDLANIAKADAVVLLPGWEGSKGAKIEVHIAWGLDMPIYLWYDDPPFESLSQLPRLQTRYNTAADKARGIISGERHNQYGSAERNLTTIGKLWGTILQRGDIPPRTVALMMIALKVARDIYSPKEDNLVDICGYALLAEEGTGEDNG